MLSPRMPDLSALEVLVRVAATGSLNVAAKELGRTQQAVSARIAAIEAQTGVTLFVRTPKGSTLTPAGAIVADWAGRLLDNASEFDAALAALRHERSVQLRVASSLTIAERLLPTWLVTLRAESADPPAVTLYAANSGTVAEQVRTGKADVGFVEGPRAPRGLRTRVIAHDRLVLVVAPDHPWARSHGVDVSTLARTSLVTREVGSGTRDALDVAVRDVLHGDPPMAPPMLELSTTAGVRAAVLSGAGPAVLSELVVRDEVMMGRLRRVPVQGLELGRDLRAVWTTGRTPPAGPARDLVAIAGRARRMGAAS